MAVRNKKRRCRNCPERIESMVQAQPEQKQIPTPVFHITSQTEAERLWQQTLFGAGVMVGMIEGYQGFGMPGQPAEAIRALVTRLQKVLGKIEARNEV